MSEAVNERGADKGDKTDVMWASGRAFLNHDAASILN